MTLISLCSLFGCQWDYTDEYTERGRHRGLKVCTVCDQREVAWTGPIFPGRADDPQAAVEYIDQHEDYAAPDPGSPTWY